MFKDKRVLAVVPARGGSKGVALKNLQKVGGLSLVAIVGRLVKSLPWVDRAVVSTDHEVIAEEAKLVGLLAPFRRPEFLAGDIISDLDVLTHALLEMEGQDNCHYEVVVMLQPTCPLRLPQHVTAAVKKLVVENLDAVWTVTETDLKFHPLKQLVVDAEGRLSYYDSAGARIIARQQLSPVYYRNGAAYVFSRRCLLEQKTIMGIHSGAVIISDVLINIDNLEDFSTAERYLREGAQ